MNEKKSEVCKNNSTSDTNSEGIDESPTHDNVELADAPKYSAFSSKKSKFTCSVCKKSYSDKNCLRKHVRKIHEIEPGPISPQTGCTEDKVAPFKCRICDTEFSYKRNLKRHLIKYHSQGLEEEEGGNCFCSVEGCRFRSFFINALRTHLTDEHKLQIDIENKVFTSKKEFDDWKEEEEKTNVCLFIKEAGKHKLINGDQRLIYQCHRSGHYSGHGFGKRSFRVKGTCKLGKRCTAGIELTIKEKGDIHEVVYYKTHIWHEPDVIHVNLSASERAYLADKLKEGASIPSILQSVKTNNCENANFCKRIQLLKRKDLVNIENTFRLNNTERNIRKQHRRGQKITHDNIKKNIDSYGDVVSWVIESSSSQSEYFTVKKLLSEKCLERCGVVCALCDTCLHMYSCTCHEYLVFGTMCQHIHAVSLSSSPIQKQERFRSSVDCNASRRKCKKQDSDNLHPDLMLPTGKPPSSVTDPRETDIMNFLNQNFEHKLPGDRIRLKDKVNSLNELCATKINLVGEDVVQLLTRIVDSAIQLFHPSDTSNESGISTVAPLPVAVTVSTAPSPASNGVYQELLQPSTMISVTPSDSLPVAASAAVDSLSIAQQQAVVREEDISHLTVLNAAAPQYCTTALRRKRKVEETIPSATFHRSHTFDKRNFYDSSSMLMNNALSNGDSYTAFDYNATTSWQTPPSSAGSPSVW